MSQHSPDPTRIILRPGERVYHLDLAPGDVASTLLTVGDPARVPRITQHFDEIFLQRQYREFTTVTGRIGKEKLTVLSTGMGSDNIDIVLNELELLFNWDLVHRRPLADRKSFRLIRLGTSGALQPDLPVDSLLVSRWAFSMDVLHHFYPKVDGDAAVERALNAFAQSHHLPPFSLFPADETLTNSLLKMHGAQEGFTFTASGFYAPQGRELWKAHADETGLLDWLSSARLNGQRISNVEMETAALFHLGRLFGHSIASVSALLANRPKGAFSDQAEATVDRMIESVLSTLF